MNVTDSGYLDTQGFSVIFYHSTFDRTFVDQKNTALEMILYGQRIATNGDVGLVPTPEAVGRSRTAQITYSRQNQQIASMPGFPFPTIRWTTAWK